MNSMPIVPYLIRTTIAKRDPSYRHPSDSRFNGWWPVKGEDCTKCVDRVLDEQMLSRYIDERLNEVDRLLMFRAFTSRKKKTASNERGASVYKYYLLRTGAQYRVGVEMILMTVIDAN